VIDKKQREKRVHTHKKTHTYTHTHIETKTKRDCIQFFVQTNIEREKNNEIHSTLTHIVIEREAHTHIYTQKDKKREIIYVFFV